MKAMIFAAGLGTRMKPITNYCPKALIEYKGAPLLEQLLLKLKGIGIREVVINVHHFPEQIIDFLEKNQSFGMEIHISDERNELLDTGGGLLKAAEFFADGQPFLVHNVDVVSDIDLQKMRDEHLKTAALATLAVRDRDTNRKLLFDDSKCLKGWQNNKTNEVIYLDTNNTALKALAFSGIQILSPSFFQHLTLNGKFSMIDAYLQVAKTQAIKAYEHHADTWLDVGKIEVLER